MIPKNEATKQKRLTFKLITFSLLLFSPISYLVVAYFVTHPSGEPIAIKGAGETELAFNIMLIISFVFPFVYPLIEKVQISMFKKNQNKIKDRYELNNSINEPEPSSSFIIRFLGAAKFLILGKGMEKATDIPGLYQSVSIIKLALVSVTYILGLALVFITLDMSYLIYFYPIGIVWTIIYWPRESKYHEFKRKLEIV